MRLSSRHLVIFYNSHLYNLLTSLHYSTSSATTSLCLVYFSVRCFFSQKAFLSSTFSFASTFNTHTFAIMLANIWILSALCAGAIAAPTLSYSTKAVEKPADMKLLASYFKLLADKVQAGRNMAEAPVCNLANAVLPTTCTSPFPPLTHTSANEENSTALTSHRRRSPTKTCRHWKRNTELYLRHKLYRSSLSNWRHRNPLQRFLHCIYLPRPPPLSPRRRTTIRTPSCTIHAHTFQPRY